MWMAFLQFTLTQISAVVGLLTILGVAAAVLRAIFNLGNRVGKVEQNILDKFDAVTKETQAQKAALDKVTSELTEHCDDEGQHVNVRLAEFQDIVLNKRLDEMGQKLNLLLLGNHNPNA